MRATSCRMIRPAEPAEPTATKQFEQILATAERAHASGDLWLAKLLTAVHVAATAAEVEADEPERWRWSSVVSLAAARPRTGHGR